MKLASKVAAAWYRGRGRSTKMAYQYRKIDICAYVVDGDLGGELVVKRIAVITSTKKGIVSDMIIKPSSTKSDNSGLSANNRKNLLSRGSNRRGGIYNVAREYGA